MRLIFVFFSILALAACQSNQNVMVNTQIDDPVENWNRYVFEFNNTLDEYALEPVSEGYDIVTPGAVRLLVQNELDYIQSPVTIINSALQGNLDVFLHTFGRFFINTTLGGLGLLDPASDFGLKPHQEDFGQTLAVWGVPDGGYHMMPIFGPTTIRGLVGRFVDIGFDPVTHIQTNTLEAMVAARALGVVEFRAQNLDLIDNLRDSSLDFYASIREIFIQRRIASIKNATFSNNNDAEPEFIDFDEE